MASNTAFSSCAKPIISQTMSYHLHTKRGYSFPDVSSAMQKAVRRGDARLAGYWALELWASGFGQYVWRRLLTVSAEDCWGILTAEVKALHDSYTEINRNTPAKTPKGCGQRRERRMKLAV
jgi:replication-associated recombination protein RarA